MKSGEIEMLRVFLFVSLLSLGAPLWAQPTPLSSVAQQPDGKIALQPLSDLGSQCICASYPIYEEDGDVLYYSEVCAPATDCSVSDVAYYWGEPTISWPLTCNTGNPNGACADCFDLNKKATRPPKNVAGLKDILPSNTTTQLILPPSVPLGSNTAPSPRSGFRSDYSDHTYVKFIVDSDIVYAQLYIVKVNTSKAMAPIQPPRGQAPDRFLFIGYEVDYDATEMANAILVRSEIATGRTTMQLPSNSKTVRKVSIGPNKYLVLLKRRATAKQ
jgi:hypothetical protein